MSKTFTDFINKNFKHFNSHSIVKASKEWISLLNNNGKMFLSIGGAMSTAEIGIILAELIRNDKVHAISATGANLEEDIFNLLHGKNYKKIENWENLCLKDDDQLENRVLDTCIPESVMRYVEKLILPLWKKAEESNTSYFPHEYFFQLLDHDNIKDLDKNNSWVAAAKEKNIPIFIPGWEDSTIGNVIVSEKIRKKIKSFNMIKTGLEYMESLIDWYSETDKNHKIGFFQIGGGIAGDFAICVVPLICQDLNDKKAIDFDKYPNPYKPVNYWSYFCQISNGNTSYGSYSQAGASEKITWGKLNTSSKMFNIESDATIVFPLISQYILEN